MHLDLSVQTKTREEFVNITEQLNDLLAENGAKDGCCTVMLINSSRVFVWTLRSRCMANLRLSGHPFFFGSKDLQPSITVSPTSIRLLHLGARISKHHPSD